MTQTRVVGPIAASLVLLLALTAAEPVQARQEITSEITTGKTLRGPYDGPPLLVRTGLKYEAFQLIENWDFKAGLTQSQFDYSKLELFDELARPLNSPPTKSEFSANLGLAVSISDWRVFTDWGGHISESPYRSQSESLGLEHSDSTGRLRVGGLANWGALEQPKSFYIEPTTAQTKVRPVLLRSQTQQVYSEVAWSESWKGHYTLGRGDRFEDRPPHYIFEMKHAYAVSSRASARIDLGLKEEDRTVKLRDDRGYLKVQWVEGLFLYQPHWKWTVGVGLGAQVEEENRPWNGETVVRGVDSGLVRVGFESRTWRATAKNRVSFTNRDQAGVEVQGGITWSL